MQSIRAFQESRILLTALELDVFSALGEGAAAPDVARHIGGDPRATEMLLNALTALGLLVKRDGRFFNGPDAARHFVAGSPDDARLALMHAVHMWDRWARLTECVRTGTAAALPEIEDRGDTWIEAFIAAMHNHAQERAPVVAGAVGADQVSRMLDVGGGSGAYSIAFAQANPQLRGVVFDLKPVLAIAQGHVDRAGLAGRITTCRGDLRTDDYGTGFDLVFISAICHMLSPEENVAMFRKSFAALLEGGRIVVQDFILEADKTAPLQAAVFSLNMLVGTRGGASYSHVEYADWLAQAGFRDVREIRLPGPTGLMAGVRP